MKMSNMKTQVKFARLLFHSYFRPQIKELMSKCCETQPKCSFLNEDFEVPPKNRIIIVGSMHENITPSSATH